MDLTPPDVVILNDETGIPDPNLYAAILAAADGVLGDETDGVLTVSEAEAITSLEASEAEITDLTGIANCRNLTDLRLVNNSINDISALAALNSLELLYLNNNNIGDITALSKLSKLKYLFAEDNDINDISSLSGLVKLRELWLKNNDISDIQVFLNLTSLKWADLTNNKVSDASILESLPNLQCVLTGNPVSGSEDGDSGTMVPGGIAGVLLQGNGVVSVKAGIPYGLGDGTWKVKGDTTSYAGGITFYVASDGEYEFTVE